jgi:drug/metabolite transporter (DMT)-like permease
MSRRPGVSAYIALASVCVFWGTTYLAIRISIETLPPAFVVCSRFLLSGSILLIIARMMGAHLPRGRDLRVACLCGALTLGVGNASAVYAERIIPSGLASLFVTILPFWMVGFDALMGGELLHAPTIAGMLIGFGGTALLLLPGTGTPSHSTLIGFLIMEAGAIGWTLGSLYQRRQAARAHPIVTGAVQQLAAGLLYIPIAVLEPSKGLAFSARSIWALLYLVAFGSIVSYSAYVFAMDRLPVSIVSVYPYFNALVAMWLGWFFFREPFGLREWIAMLVIFAGVGIVKWQTGRRK